MDHSGTRPPGLGGLCLRLAHILLDDVQEIAKQIDSTLVQADDLVSAVCPSGRQRISAPR